MPRDEVAVAALVGSFAVWLTVHVIVAAKLSRRRPWWRGPLAFVVPPLAPFWAMRSGPRTFGVAWLLAFTAWLVCRVFLAR
jgi:hypothetical protein